MRNRHLASDGELFLRTVDICGHRFLAYHGHGIRMYQSIALYGIAQRIVRWMGTQSRRPDRRRLPRPPPLLRPVAGEREDGVPDRLAGDRRQLGLVELGLEDSPRWWLLGVGDRYPVTCKYALGPL